MICPKCGKDVPRNNFCGNCGAKLLEKCPKCGKTEPIGRKVCETKSEEARQKLNKYLENEAGNWRETMGRAFALLFCPFIAICIAIKVILSCATPDLKTNFAIIPLIIGSYIISFPVLNWAIKKQKQAGEKAKQKFLQENPDYAEILREAEKR